MDGRPRDPVSWLDDNQQIGFNCRRLYSCPDALSTNYTDERYEAARKSQNEATGIAVGAYQGFLTRGGEWRGKSNG